jgi:DNA modification methylase
VNAEQALKRAMREPNGYEQASLKTPAVSLISNENHRAWFRAIWYDVLGPTGKDHPAPFRGKLTERLIHMFSFVGHTVLDPFLGTGTTTLFLLASARNSISVEVDPAYFENATERIKGVRQDLPSDSRLEIHRVTLQSLPVASKKRAGRSRVGSNTHIIVPILADLVTETGHQLDRFGNGLGG